MAANGRGVPPNALDATQRPANAPLIPAEPPPRPVALPTALSGSISLNSSSSAPSPALAQAKKRLKLATSAAPGQRTPITPVTSEPSMSVSDALAVASSGGGAATNAISSAAAISFPLARTSRGCGTEASPTQRLQQRWISGSKIANKLQQGQELRFLSALGDVHDIRGAAGSDDDDDDDEPRLAPPAPSGQSSATTGSIRDPAREETPSRSFTTTSADSPADPAPRARSISPTISAAGAVISLGGAPLISTGRNIVEISFSVGSTSRLSASRSPSYR